MYSCMLAISVYVHASMWSLTTAETVDLKNKKKLFLFQNDIIYLFQNDIIYN